MVQYRSYCSTEFSYYLANLMLISFGELCELRASCSELNAEL